MSVFGPVGVHAGVASGEGGLDGGGEEEFDGAGAVAGSAVGTIGIETWFVQDFGMVVGGLPSIGGAGEYGVDLDIRCCYN